MKHPLKMMLVTLLLLSGCATVPKAPLVFRPGAAVNTLTASVSLSVKTPTGGAGGNGYLLFTRPDRFRVVMLTPFGTTALEFCASGENVTVAIPSQGVAYVGSYADLPDRNGLQAWRLMKWAVEGDPLYDPSHAGCPVRRVEGGSVSLAFYDDAGLLQRKVAEEGSEVLYRDYTSVDGVPLPTVIEFTDPRGAKVKVTFKEPEVNQPLEEAALSPHLEGLDVRSLAQFRGM